MPHFLYLLKTSENHTLSHVFRGGGAKKVPVKPDIFRILKAQSAFTCSKLTIEILEQGVRYVQS